MRRENTSSANPIQAIHGGRDTSARPTQADPMKPICPPRLLPFLARVLTFRRAAALFVLLALVCIARALMPGESTAHHAGSRLASISPSDSTARRWPAPRSGLSAQVSAVKHPAAG